MTSPETLAAWRDQLAKILDDVIALAAVLRDDHRAGGISLTSVVVGDGQTRDALGALQDRIRRANAAAEQLLTTDPGLADVVHPLLSIPGEKPAVDLRPWWTRILDRVSSDAKRARLAEAFETLRLEADDAVMRATGRLARIAR